MPGADVAAAAGVDGADGHPGDGEVAADGGGDHFDFKFKAAFPAGKHGFHEAAADEAIAGLVVVDAAADGPGEKGKAGQVGEAADGGHLAKLARADDEVGRSSLVGFN